jgi:hypothetical protein
MYPQGWQGSSRSLPRNDNPRKEENDMSKMNDMAQAIEELRNAAAAINDIANWLTEAFSSDPETEAAPAPAPAAKEPEPVLAFEDVRAILADKSREGFTAQIRELLQKYGGSKLSEVDTKHYKALIADVEGLSNG